MKSKTVVGNCINGDKKISNIDAFIRIFDTKDGKDKIIKIIQYSLRLVLWSNSHTSLRQYLSTHPKHIHLAVFYLTLLKWSTAIVPQFSLFRNILRFGNWMRPLRSLTTQQQSHSKCLDEVIDLYNAVFDDLYLFTKIGLLVDIYPRLGKVADRQANYAWMCSIVLGLEREYRKLSALSTCSTGHSNVAKTKDSQRADAHSQYCQCKECQQRFLSQLNATKLFCDLIFCGLDLAELRVSPLIPTAAGLVSAIIGYYKIYLKL